MILLFERLIFLTDWLNFCPMFVSHRAQVYDSSWEFTHNGYISQNDAPDGLMHRTWKLRGQRTCVDATNVTWDNDKETVAHFWLPFKPGATGSIVTGCRGLEIAPGACWKDSPKNRRWGNAGIVGTSADSDDPAPAWAPHLKSTPGQKLLFVHQGLNVSKNVTIVYRLAPVPEQPPSSFVWKLNAQGSTTWALRSGAENGGGEVTMRGVAVDLAGGIFATGYLTGGNATFGDQILSSSTTSSLHDSVLWKINEQGTTTWAVEGGGDGVTEVHGVAVDGAGDAAVLVSWRNPPLNGSAAPAPASLVPSSPSGLVSVTFGEKTFQLPPGTSNPVLLWKVRSVQLRSDPTCIIITVDSLTPMFDRVESYNADASPLFAVYVAGERDGDVCLDFSRRRCTASVRFFICLIQN
jgi:hypothetical protein